MALARCNFAVQDYAGNVIHGASVEVRREVTDVLAAVYSDRAGTAALGNPFVAVDGGDAGFHVVGGAYKITATLGSFTRTWRYVAIGLAQETDIFELPIRYQSGVLDIGFVAPDSIVFRPNEGLATPAIDTTTTMTVVSANMQVDKKGRWFFTVGSPNTATPGGGYDTLHPFKVVGQPNGLPTYFNIMATLDSSVVGDGTNVFNCVAYSLSPSTHGHYAANFTTVSAGTSTGAGALAASIYRTGGTAFCHAVDIQLATDTVSSGAGEIGGPSVIIAQHGGTPRNVDFFYEMKSTGAGLGATHGIRINGNAAIATAGTILGLKSGTALSCANGIDLAGVTFSGVAFRSTGFSVDGTGNASVAQQLAIASDPILQLTGGFHVVYGPGSGIGATVLLGPTGDKSIYYDTNAHVFRDATHTATFARITSGGLGLSGSTSGTLTIKPPAAAGTNTITFPAGTTDFSATGGPSRVLMQTAAGAAITVAQLAASNLSNGTTGTGVVVLGTSPTITTNITVRGAQSAFQLQESAGGAGYIIGRSLSGDNAQNFFLYDQVAPGAVLTVDSSRNVDITAGNLNIAAAATYKVGGTQVVSARNTGWAAMTGTTNKATVYDTATVTTAQLAGRVMALQAALTTHGLIGA